MTLDQFVAKYNGKGVDFDGYFGNQCMDLANQFVQDVWGKSGWDIARGFAYQVWTEFNALPVSKYATRIPNTPTGVPPAGALIIWSTGIGPAGHIAVTTGVGNTNTFQSFDQNWNSHQYCELVTHNYNHVYGWIILNPIKQGDIMDTATGGELYLTALHRQAESAGAAGQWNGRTLRDALIVLRSTPEWQATDVKVKNFDALQSKVAELSKNPTKAELQAVVDQLASAQKEVQKAQEEVAKVKAEKSEDTELINETGNFLTRWWDRLFKGGK